MARIDTAAVVVDGGHFYTAPVGTAAPTNFRDPDADWDEIGHTSLDEVFSASSEGGEQSVLGTLQNRSLRTSRTPRTESFSIVLQQFDESALKLYYGSNMVTVEQGRLLGVPSNPAPTERAFLAVFLDGENELAFYCPRAQIFRGDDLEIADVESLASLPLEITPLQHGNNPYPYAITPLGVSGP